jgi:hypothetical protein
MPLCSKCSRGPALPDQDRFEAIVNPIAFPAPTVAGYRPPVGAGQIRAFDAWSVNETGGSLFEVTGKVSLDEIYSRIQEELRSQYVIGYTPPRADASQVFRSISLRARDKNLKVNCRTGYYARQVGQSSSQIDPKEFSGLQPERDVVGRDRMGKRPQAAVHRRKQHGGCREFGLPIRPYVGKATLRQSRIRLREAA